MREHWKPLARHESNTHIHTHTQVQRRVQELQEQLQRKESNIARSDKIIQKLMADMEDLKRAA